MTAYSSIYQNSYIMFVITFIVVSAICYLFEIGFNVNYHDGKIVKKFSWKYPLGIALIVWVIWHFFLFPPGVEHAQHLSHVSHVVQPESVPMVDSCTMNTNKLIQQKINMANWN